MACKQVNQMFHHSLHSTTLFVLYQAFDIVSRAGAFFHWLPLPAANSHCLAGAWRSPFARSFVHSFAVRKLRLRIVQCTAAASSACFRVSATWTSARLNNVPRANNERGVAVRTESRYAAEQRESRRNNNSHVYVVVKETERENLLLFQNNKSTVI